MRLEFAGATLTRLTFRNNTGGSNGLIPGADMQTYYSDVTVSECRFSNSIGGTGDARHSGALMIQYASNCRVLDSTFEDAYSEGDGGSALSLARRHPASRRCRCRASFVPLPQLHARVLRI